METFWEKWEILICRVLMIVVCLVFWYFVWNFSFWALDKFTSPDPQPTITYQPSLGDKTATELLKEEGIEISTITWEEGD